MSEQEISKGPESQMRELDNLLLEMKQFETDRPHGENDEVDKVLNIVRRVFESRKPFHIEDEVLILYIGSLQYHDPVNLDIDISFVDKEDSEESNYTTYLSKIYQEEFGRVDDWPREGIETNFVGFAIDSIKRTADDLSRGKSTDPDKIRFSVSHALEILSGSLLFPEQEDLRNIFKEEVKVILRETPEMRTGVINLAKDVIKTREERRLNL